MKFIKYVIGNPASGKSTLIKRFWEDLTCGLDDVYYHNVDHYKGYSLIEKGFTLQQIHDLARKQAEKEVIKRIINNENIIAETTIKSFKDNIENIKKLQARGYFVEIYFIPPCPNLKDYERNSKRKYPTPEHVFIMSKFMFENNANYSQNIYFENNSLYSSLLFYKTFKDKQQVGAEIEITGEVKQDFNAIHFSCDKNNAKLYHSHLYQVEPIGKVYKYGNIFYSKGIKVIKES